jgi:hypothetical protein
LQSSAFVNIPHGFRAGLLISWGQAAITAGVLFEMRPEKTQQSSPSLVKMDLNTGV